MLIARMHKATAADLENLRSQVLHRLLARTPVTVAIVVEVVFEVSEFLGASGEHEAEVYEAMIEHFALTDE